MKSRLYMRHLAQICTWRDALSSDYLNVKVEIDNGYKEFGREIQQLINDVFATGDCICDDRASRTKRNFICWGSATNVQQDNLKRIPNGLNDINNVTTSTGGNSIANSPNAYYNLATQAETPT